MKVETALPCTGQINRSQPMVRTLLPQNYLKKPIRPDLGEAACSRDRRAESATGITQINLEERMHG
jgi:hypothetical protein